VITGLIFIFYPINYNKGGAGFRIAIYLALFATIYAVVANAAYIWIGLNGKLKSAGGSISHLGFALMLTGMLITSSNKEVISSSTVNGINLPVGKDPMSKEQDDPLENLTLIRHVPARLGNYEVTYLKDSIGNEKGRRFYGMQFQRKNAAQKITEDFVMLPDVYQMKDNNMSSNPEIKTYLTRDIFTYISYAPNALSQSDTTQFKVQDLHQGDTIFYSNGIIIFNGATKNPVNERYQYKPTDAAIMADLTIISKDSMHYKAMPLIYVDDYGINHIDDTLYAQNIFLRFEGIGEHGHVRIGVKESDKIIDFVTIKAYVFPYINLVWAGLIIMAFGFAMSAVRRAGLSTIYGAVGLILAGAGLFYMFLIAN